MPDRDAEQLDEAAVGPEDRGPDDHGPEIAEADRFFVNGRALAFAAWVDEVMALIGERELVEPQPQPAPESPEVVWMSRRPVE